MANNDSLLKMMREGADALTLTHPHLSGPIRVLCNRFERLAADAKQFPPRDAQNWHHVRDLFLKLDGEMRPVPPGGPVMADDDILPIVADVLRKAADEARAARKPTAKGPPSRATSTSLQKARENADHLRKHFAEFPVSGLQRVDWGVSDLVVFGTFSNEARDQIPSEWFGVPVVIRPSVLCLQTDCGTQAAWIRHTQFAGNHWFCNEHAHAESDFGVNDGTKDWEKLS